MLYVYAVSKDSSPDLIFNIRNINYPRWLFTVMYPFIFLIFIMACSVINVSFIMYGFVNIFIY